jgi:hypothetical protein
VSAATLRRCDAATLRHCDAATLRHCDAAHGEGDWLMGDFGNVQGRELRW